MMPKHVASIEKSDKNEMYPELRFALRNLLANMNEILICMSIFLSVVPGAGIEPARKLNSEGF